MANNEASFSAVVSLGSPQEARDLAAVISQTIECSARLPRRLAVGSYQAGSEVVSMIERMIYLCASYPPIAVNDNLRNTAQAIVQSMKQHLNRLRKAVPTTEVLFYDVNKLFRTLRWKFAAVHARYSSNILIDHQLVVKYPTNNTGAECQAAVAGDAVSRCLIAMAVLNVSLVNMEINSIMDFMILQELAEVMENDQIERLRQHVLYAIPVAVEISHISSVSVMRAQAPQVHSAIDNMAAGLESRAQVEQKPSIKKALYDAGPRCRELGRSITAVAEARCAAGESGDLAEESRQKGEFKELCKQLAVVAKVALQNIMLQKSKVAVRTMEECYRSIADMRHAVECGNLEAARSQFGAVQQQLSDYHSSQAVNDAEDQRRIDAAYEELQKSLDKLLDASADRPSSELLADCQENLVQLSKGNDGAPASSHLKLQLWEAASRLSRDVSHLTRIVEGGQ